MRRKSILGAVLLVVVVAIFGMVSLSTAKRGIRRDAVRVLEIGDVVQHTNGLASGSVVLTNATDQTILLEMRSILAKREPSASEFNYAFVFAEIPGTVMIAPHSARRWTLAFPSGPPPPQPWKFRLKVAEEVRGVECAYLIANHSIRHFGEVLHGRVIGTGLITVNGTNYYLHRNEAIVGKEADLPKMAGDRSVR